MDLLVTIFVLFTLLVVCVLGIIALVFFINMLGGRPNPWNETVRSFGLDPDRFRSSVGSATKPITDHLQAKKDDQDVGARLRKYEALQRLQDLMDRGAISAEQYEAEKAALLRSFGSAD